MSSESQQKSFLSRPEGKVGLVVGCLLLVAAALGLNAILPWIIILLTNTIHAAALAAFLAFVIYVVADKRVRTLFWYGYKAVMRWATGLFIEIDPIGVLKSYVEDLTDRLGEMRTNREKLEGQMRKLKEQIAKNEAQRVHSLKLAGLSKDDETKRTVFILQSRQAGRLQKSNITLQGLLDRMVKLARVLDKTYEASEFMVKDLEGEVQVRTQERAALLAGYNAFTAAKRIIQGDGDAREMFDMAMEKLADDYGMKMGEIESFMDMSKGFIQSVDLENGVYEQDALDQLDAWEKKSEQLILGNVRVADNITMAAPALPPAQTSANDLFADMFDDHQDDAVVRRRNVK